MKTANIVSVANITFTPSYLQRVQAGLAIDWNYFVRPFRNTSQSFLEIPRKAYNSKFRCHSESDWGFFSLEKKDTFITFFLAKKSHSDLDSSRKMINFVLNRIFLTSSLEGLHFSSHKKNL